MGRIPTQTSAGIAVRGPGSVRGISFAGNEQAVKSAHQTSQVFGDLSRSLQKESARQNRIKGGELGAANPEETLRQLAEKNPEDFNVGEQAAFEMASRISSRKIEVEAKRDMQAMTLRADQGQWSSERLGTELDSIVVGYSEASEPLGAALKANLEISLDDYRNANFLKYSDVVIKRQKAARQAASLGDLVVFQTAIEDLGRSGVKEFDERLEVELNGVADTMKANGFSPTSIERQMVTLTKLGHVARVRGNYDKLSTLTEKQDFILDFEADVKVGGELSRGLLDNTSLSLLSEMRGDAGRVQRASGAIIDTLAADIRQNISGVIQTGHSPSATEMELARGQVDDLKSQGLDVSDLEIRLNNAESHVDYFNALKTMPLDELDTERQRLLTERDMGATAAGLLNLAATEKAMRELSAELGPVATAAAASLKRIGKSVEKFEVIQPTVLDDLDVAISGLSTLGHPDAAVLTQQLGLVRNNLVLYEGLRDQPNSSLDTVLQSIIEENTAQGGNPELSHRIEMLEGRITEQTQELKNDPVGWGQGVNDIKPENLITQITSAEGEETLIKGIISDRIKEVKAFSQKHGIPETYLSKVEAASIADTLSLDKSTSENLSGIAFISGLFGTEADKVFAQVADDAPFTAHVAGMLMAGQSEFIIRKALNGQKAIIAGEIKSTDQGTEQQEIERSLFTGAQSLPKTISNVTAVARALYATRPVSEDFDSEGYEKDLQHAAGAVSRNGTLFGGIDISTGSPIIIPPSIENDSLQDIWDDASLTEIERAAGSGIFAADGEPVSVNRLKERGEFIAVGYGKAELVLRENNAVQTLLSNTGTPIIVELSELVRR